MRSLSIVIYYPSTDVTTGTQCHLLHQTRRIIRYFKRPFYSDSKRRFSTAPNLNASRKPSGPESESSLPKIAVGGVAVAGAIMVAYKAGYLDQFIGVERLKEIETDNVGIHSNDEKDGNRSSENLVLSSSEEQSTLSADAGHSGEKPESVSDASHCDGLSEDKGVDASHEQDEFSRSAYSTFQEKESPADSYSNIPSVDGSTSSNEASSGGGVRVGRPEDRAILEPRQGVQVAPISADSAQAGEIPEENETKATLNQDQNFQAREECTSTSEAVAENTLLDEYHLRGVDATNSNSESSNKYENISGGAVVAALEELKDGYMSKDGKLIFDFLQAIHAAEKRQAELDARAFAEEKRAFKEKYEKELKDAIAREFMHAEEAANLDKELKREQAKGAAAFKALKEKAEEKLKMELEQKEKEIELKLKELEEVAQAELAAAIAREKAAHIEKMAEANVDINALCMAFFARSQEAHQSHTVYKLALGTLALEDALSRGLPIQKEIDALRTYVKETHKDSILELVLSSLPEKNHKCCPDSPLELTQKFNDLKKSLRHFSLVPSGGGGILAHSIAHIASWLRVKESNQSGEGIESIINKVEVYLAEGKYAEAAEALEQGVKGTQAAEVASDWVNRARNRAITEQALTFLQAYVTTSSLA